MIEYESRAGIDFTFTDEITVTEIQKMGGDHMVVAAARVSVNADDAIHWALKEFESDNSGLINFLMSHRHGTPFEHSALTMFVDAPIMVYREWHRHRIGWSYNEESGRWSELRPKFWIPGTERPLVQGPNYKPSKPLLDPLNNATIYNDFINDNKARYIDCYTTYKKNLAKGLAKEACRSILGVGIYSRCWCTCNPRSLMAFLSLRTHDPNARYVSYPQYEIQMAAKTAEKMLESGWPLTYAAFVKNGRVGP